jgi:hypothetical protein
VKEERLIRLILYMLEDCPERRLVRCHHSHELLSPSSASIVHSKVGWGRLGICSNTLVIDKLNAWDLRAGIRSALLHAT